MRVVGQIDVSASPLLRPDGGADGVVLVFRDVTEATRLSREIEYQALHDTPAAPCSCNNLLDRSPIVFIRKFRQELGISQNDRQRIV